MKRLARNLIVQAATIIALCPIALAMWLAFQSWEWVEDALVPTWRRIGEDDFWDYILPDFQWIERLRR